MTASQTSATGFEQVNAWREQTHPNSLESLQVAISSLMRLLSEEEAELQSGNLRFLEKFAREKMQLLRQLSHLSEPNQTNWLQSAAAVEINRLKQMLDNNARLLTVKMDAINEVAESINSATRNAESDGTYVVRRSTARASP